MAGEMWMQVCRAGDVVQVDTCAGVQDGVAAAAGVGLLRWGCSAEGPRRSGVCVCHMRC